jgi:hypothetical protein
MRKFQQPRCPYCGDKISLPSAWILKTQGEYLCPKCGGISNIVLDRACYLLAFLAILSSAVFFIVAFLHLAALNLWMVLLVVLPFFLFFLISVFLVRLRKPELHRKQMPQRPGPENSGRAAPPRRPENGDDWVPLSPSGENRQAPPPRRYAVPQNRAAVPRPGYRPEPRPYPPRSPAPPPNGEFPRRDPTSHIPRR